MKRLAALLVPAAGLILAACSAGSAERTAEAIASPITAPTNALINNTAPLPQEAQYTYWRRQPGTNLFEPYVSDHPLSAEEQDKLGIVPASQAAK